MRRPLGIIVRLQIQRTSLKHGASKQRVYDPAPILQVPVLAVSPDGAFGFDAAGSWVVDVHHRAHPDSKNPDGQNGLSIGLTGHYDEMRNRFGSGIELGCAGENILVETQGRCTFDELQPQLAVVAPDGTERVRLTVLDVAHPCKPFTGWALGGKQVESEVFKSHLQFLENGTRGFLLSAEHTARISVGDHVVVINEKRDA